MEELFVPQFTEWPSIARLDRPIIITRKIDGNNSAVGIHENDDSTYTVWAQSRTRIIKPGKDSDNYGFAQWVSDHEETLVVDLGPGLHFGEWWGLGIRGGYGKKERTFSLFNTSRWGEAEFVTPNLDVVEVLGMSSYFDRTLVDECLQKLIERSVDTGIREEGVVIFHTHGNLMFKKTIEKDDRGKSN